MFRTIIFSALSTIALTGAVIAEVSDAEKAQVIDAFAAALGGDDSALAPVFAEDGVWMPSSGGRYEGHVAITQAMAAFPDVAGFHAEIEEQIGLGDGFYFISGTHSLTLPEEMGGGIMPGEYVMLVQSTPEGKKILRHVAFPPRGANR